jgi:hypothetical protein
VYFLAISDPLCDMTATRSAKVTTTPTTIACRVLDTQGHTLYSDKSHLSVHGSRHLAAELIRQQQLPDISQWLEATPAGLELPQQ